VEAQQVAHAAVLHRHRTLARTFRIIGSLRIRRRHRLQFDAGEVAQALEAALRIVDVGDAARHAGGKVAPRLAQHDDDTAGHVLAALVAATFHHGERTGVAYRESFAGHALEIRLTGDRAIQHGVADDDVLSRFARRVGVTDDDAATGEALADIVVCV